MKRRLLISFLLSLSVWLVFSWPLPRHVASAIPAGHLSGTANPVLRPMEPGDHLQLMYHFWLFADFVRGGTPWFQNLYEFNTGDDAARFEPGSYYFPFSLFYAAGHAIAGPAFGWNLAGFLALWLTFHFSWRLAHRFTGEERWAALAALVSILFPYRWINLAGGSPTGFAMMWVPLLFYGLDRALRDADVRGGFWAGLALLMASWGDTHVFYFSALATPCGCVLSLALRTSLSRRDLALLAKAIWPAPALAALALASSKLMTRGIASSHAQAGRTIPEVALFSPRADGFLSWSAHGISAHIYIGYALAALLALALAVSLFHRRAPIRERMMLALLLLGLCVIGMLALGPFSPFDGRPFTAARKFIPEYTMIRQPAKVFALVPTLLVVVTALVARSAPTRAVLAVLLAAMAVEYKLHFMPLLCPLDREQPAYRAISESVARPRALVLPLWPGDSHYTSVYQYYASLYRIRLVNGYRPFVPAHYIEDVFRPLESANLGYLDEAQFERLSGMGVTHIVLHENLFPEKVSPFPVGMTLKNLLNHPRLTLAGHHEDVWSFRIESEPRERPELAADWTAWFPSRQYDRSRLKAVDQKLLTRGTSVVPAPNLRWMILARGPGELECGTYLDNAPAAQMPFQLGGAEPAWIEAPLPDLSRPATVFASVKSGGPEVDHILLAAGPWPDWEVGASHRFPAPCFFHAGFTDLAHNSVVIRDRRDPRDIVFYGPKMPVPPGRYRMDVEADIAAPAGRPVGTWFVACPEGRELAHAPWRAGEPFRIEFDTAESYPLLLALRFEGGGDLSIRAITLTRIQ